MGAVLSSVIKKRPAVKTEKQRKVGKWPNVLRKDDPELVRNEKHVRMMSPQARTEVLQKSWTEAEQELHVRQQKEEQGHDRDWFPLVAAWFNVRPNVKKVRERIWSVMVRTFKTQIHLERQENKLFRLDTKKSWWVNKIEIHAGMYSRTLCRLTVLLPSVHGTQMFVATGFLLSRCNAATTTGYVLPFELSAASQILQIFTAAIHLCRKKKSKHFAGCRRRL